MSIPENFVSLDDITAHIAARIAMGTWRDIVTHEEWILALVAPSLSPDVYTVRQAIDLHGFLIVKKAP